MHGKFLLSTALALALGGASAGEVELAPGHPQSYTVATGDTLWDIAGRFLAQPWQWAEVWQVNPQIKDPNLIYPGDVISLTDHNGHPVLGLARAGTPTGREVKLSPSMRETSHGEAIPPIPMGAIRQFLSRPLVVTKAQIDTAGYVVGSEDEHLVVGPGSRVYVRGLKPGDGANFSVFRTGERYIDPVSHEVLGFEALHVADLAVSEFGDPSTARVGWASREVLKKDKVMPQENGSVFDFVPRPPAQAVDGQIIAVVDGVSQIGQHNVVVLNRGSADGLAPGNVLAIFQAGVAVPDPVGSEASYRAGIANDRAAAEAATPGPSRIFGKMRTGLRKWKLAFDEAVGERIGGKPGSLVLPPQRAGELLVFRTAERVSFALVMDTHRPAHVLDRVANP